MRPRDEFAELLIAQTVTARHALAAITPSMNVYLLSGLS